MTLDTVFKTKTMARIFEAQGQLEKAAEIYLFLLQQEPCRDDLAAELACIRQQMRQGEGGRKPGKDLGPLYEQWLRLVFDYHRKYYRIVNGEQ